METNFSFQAQQFNRLFPFYIHINKDMQVESVGDTLEKIFPGTAQQPFLERFVIKRPEQVEVTADTLKSLATQLVVLEAINKQKTTLRGQIEYNPEKNDFLFLGSPWFGSIEEVIENNLILSDFAYHDPMIDLLHVLKTQEITTEDLKQLLKTINKQKNELKAANKEIHEIALFPTQNPDPLIRINMAGDLLRLNPAAGALNTFQYENNSYSLEELLKYIATQIDTEKDRWIFEARSGEKDYSFACITMLKDGYVNIYGRDITKQKKDQLELNRLSLIIQQTQNAVIVTDASGKVEWVNNAFEKVTGYTLQDVKGKKPGSVLQGKDTDPVTVKYLREQISKSESFTCEIYNYKKSGEGYWLRINGQPIFNQSGKVTQFFAIEEDITKERQAQEKLKEFDKRINIAMQKIGDNVWEHDFLTEQTSFSQQEYQLLGYTSNDFNNNVDLWYNSIYHDDKKIVEENDIKYRSGEIDHHSLEYRILHKDGTIKWVLDRGVVLEKAKDGKPLKIIGTHTDITEQKEIEKKLDEQRKFYEEILDNIPADIAVFDNQHTYLYVNPRAIKDANLRKWLVGKKDEDYVRFRNLSDSILEGRNKLFKTVLEMKQLISFEEELKKTDGSSNYILRNMYPVINNKGEVDLVIGYGIDISNIKNIQQQIQQSEKRYRDLINNSLAIITTHNLDGKFVTVNPMVGKLFGYTDDELIGHSLEEFMPAEDRVAFQEMYLATIKKDKQASGIFRVLDTKGNIIYCLYNNFLNEEPGKEPYIIGFAVDITDRIKAEKELRIAKKVTEELAQTKQNFLANMSHEIRTPMNAILGMSRQLQKTTLNEKQHFYLDSISSASENLLVIINDILDLSKIDAGKLTLEQIGFQPKLVVDRVMQVMIHKAEEKGLALTNALCDSKLSDVLIGDPYRLNQILLNLVSNSIKFTEKGSVDISCVVLNETATHQKIKVSVKDSGIGMEESFVKNLFRKFTQEDDSVSRKFGGTGLGMSISKELVELMDGNIFVESKKGAGTTVSFEVEFEKGTKQDLPLKDHTVINTNDLLGKKILVVDDNEMNRLVATTILNDYGADIAEVVNGQEAVNVLSQNEFDLVLMDVQMPVMNGFEATQIIRNELKLNVPVIALTANAIKGENEKCLAAGMNDYLTKPFEENDLLQIISRWLGKKVEVRQNEVIVETNTALYDLSKLQNIAKGNQAFIDKMTNLFIEQAPASVNEMKTAFAINDFSKVGAIAHRMKPSIDNMGIVFLKDVIRSVEKNAADQLTAEEINEVINLIEEVINKVVVDLKRKNV